MEGTAKWLATGLENQGGLTAGRSIRLPSALACPEDWCRDYESRLGSSTLPRAAYGGCGNMGVALALHASQKCGSIPPSSTDLLNDWLSSFR